MAKQGKSGKRPDDRPARKRYWGSRRLQKKKVRNIIRHTDMNEQEATSFWLKVRKGRMPR